MLLIGNVLYCVANLLTKLSRQDNTELLFQQIADTALSALAVDTDNISVVLSAYVLGVYWQVWNIPAVCLSLVTPLHTLCNSVLMRA